MNISPLSSNMYLEREMLTKKNENEQKDFSQTLEKAMKTKDNEKIKEACQEVETYMLTILFKQMKASTEMGERLIPKGDYEEMFDDYNIQEQCKNLTKAGGIGLADMMYKQILPKR